MKIILIVIGGFLGAVIRYFISNRYNNKLPFGTFWINIVGSFILGYLFYLSVSANLYTFIGIGFCGALTTFSTFKLETFQLVMNKQSLKSILYTFLSYIVGILAAFAGYFLGILHS